MKNKIKRNNADIETTIEQYSSMIFKVAFSYTKNKEIAEDVLQNVLIKYMVSSCIFENSEHQKAWLLKVTVNECKKHYRSLHYQWNFEKKNMAENGSTDKHDIYYAIMELSPKYRIVIHLYYYEELSIKEISNILNMKENTIMSLLYRARQKLKTIMEEEYGY